MFKSLEMFKSLDLLFNVALVVRLPWLFVFKPLYFPE